MRSVCNMQCLQHVVTMQSVVTTNFVVTLLCVVAVQSDVTVQCVPTMQCTGLSCTMQTYLLVCVQSQLKWLPCYCLTPVVQQGPPTLAFSVERYCFLS